MFDKVTDKLPAYPVAGAIAGAGWLFPITTTIVLGGLYLLKK